MGEHPEHHFSLTDEQRIDWLCLIRSDHIGPRTFWSLLGHCGDVRTALARLPDFARRGGASRSGTVYPREQAEAELAAGHRLGVFFHAPGEPGYPPSLALLDDAPPLLAVRGNPDIMAKPMVGIVGSRNASGAGLKFAERLARELGGDAGAGLAIISGLARGIDQAAHRASMASGTVAVLAGGHDHIYPPEHVGLLRALIEAGGAAISEMPMGHMPRGRDFPRRNRLISGAALGVVVVEAAHRSGSLITARLANEQGREVFAVPGSPLDPRAEGSNHLIKQGATLVTCAADITEVLAPMLARPLPLPIRETEHMFDDTEETKPDDRARITALLGPAPISIDDIIRLAQLAPATVRTILLELELAGRLERHHAGMISLVL